MRFYIICVFCFFFFKQKTAYEMRISDWSSDVCSSDLPQRIAAILNEAQHFGKDCLVQRAIGKRGPDFRQQVGFLERRGAGDGQDMLGQDIKPAGTENVGVSLPRLYGVDSGARFKLYDAVAGDPGSQARRVEVRGRGG